MKKTLLAASIAALAFAPAAYAENYQMEGGIHYNNVDYDGPSSFKDDNFGFDFTYHLNQVSTSGHPLQEAGFLERSTNIGASYNNWNGDLVDGNFYGLNGEAFIEDFYINANIDLNSPSGSGSKNTTDFGVKAGFLPMDGLLLTLGYDIKEDAQVKNSKLKDLSTISLGGKYVTQLDGDMALNVEAEVSQADDNDDTVIYTLGGDFYFNNAMSAGVWFSDSDKKNAKTEFGIRGNYFVTPLVSVNAHYTNNYGYAKKDTALGIGANLRF